MQIQSSPPPAPPPTVVSGQHYRRSLLSFHLNIWMLELMPTVARFCEITPCYYFHKFILPYGNGLHKVN